MKATDVSEMPAQTTQQVVPTWDNELNLYSRGYNLVAGVDEAGRGAWAGPLVAGAVIFPPAEVLAANFGEESLSARLSTLRDSKMLSECVREELLGAITATALALGVGIVSPVLVDVIGLGAANRLAMARAIRDLGIRPDYLLIDAFRLPSVRIPQLPIIKGDASCMSIAAASIVAKVTRDRIMYHQDTLCPGYSFGQHKGYGTPHHVEALSRLGASSQHRHSYAPIKALLNEQYVSSD
jgi:ribonuclease HII